MSTSVVYHAFGPQGASSCGATASLAVAVRSLLTNTNNVTGSSPS